MLKIKEIDTENTLEITEDEKNILVDNDLIFFDGKEWLFNECVKFWEVFIPLRKQK